MKVNINRVVTWKRLVYGTGAWPGLENRCLVCPDALPAQDKSITGRTVVGRCHGVLWVPQLGYIAGAIQPDETTGVWKREEP